MSWTNICIEAFCFGELDDNDCCPCGNTCTSNICIENNHCPHLAYSDTTERSVAAFPPFRLILKDRISIWWEGLCFTVSWLFWWQLWFNRRKDREFLDNIKVVEPTLTEKRLEAELQKDFIKWHKKLLEVTA